jgi:hypothetical protein
MPYATKLLGDELQTYLNMGMRFLTAKGVTHLETDVFTLPEGGSIQEALDKPLPQAPTVDTRVPKYEAAPEKVADAEEDLFALGRISEETVVDAADQAQLEADELAAMAAEDAAAAAEDAAAAKQPNAGATANMAGPAISLGPETYNYGDPRAYNQMPSQQMSMQPMQMQMPPQPMQMQPMQMQMPPQQMQPMQQSIQSIQGVPQVIQSGGYQEIQPAPFTNAFNTITIDTRPIQGGSAERQTRRKEYSQRGREGPAPPSASAKITVRKVG